MSTTAYETQSGRHPVNVGHLVMGIAFLGIVGAWALIQTDVVDGSDIRWLLPVPWVLAGLGGLLAIGLSGSRRRTTRQVGWVAPGETAGPTDNPDNPDSPDPDDTENEENR